MKKESIHNLKSYLIHHSFLRAFVRVAVIILLMMTILFLFAGCGSDEASKHYFTVSADNAYDCDKLDDCCDYMYSIMYNSERTLYDAFNLVASNATDDDISAEVIIPKDVYEAYRSHRNEKDMAGFVHYSFLFDHPEYYFYTNKFTDYSLGASVEYKSSDASYHIFVTKLSAYDKYEEEKKVIDEGTAKFMESIDLDASDYDIAVQIYKKLRDEMSYDYEAVENEKKTSKISPDYERTIYKGFNEGKVNCAGYAGLYKYLLKQAGIMSAYVTGSVTEYVDYEYNDFQNHIWNIVYIDGKWYECDLTLDSCANPKSSDFLFLTTEQMKKVTVKEYGHTWDYFHERDDFYYEIKDGGYVNQALLPIAE